MCMERRSIAELCPYLGSSDQQKPRRSEEEEKTEQTDLDDGSEESRDSSDNDEPERVLEFGRGFEATLNLQCKFNHDPAVAQIVKSVWEQVQKERTHALVRQEQDELNVGMAFMMPDVVLAIKEDPRSPGESRRAAAFVLDHARPRVLEKYVSPLRQTAFSAVPPPPISLKGCNDKFERRLMTLIKHRWRDAFDKARTDAWQLAVEGKSEVPAQLIAVVSSEVLLNEASLAEAHKVITDIIDVEIEHRLKRYNTEGDAALQLLRSIRSPLVKDERVRDVLSIIGHKDDDVKRLIQELMTNKASRLFECAEVITYLRDTSHQFAATEKNRPLSYEALQRWFAQWDTMFEQEIRDFIPDLNKKCVYVALACLCQRSGPASSRVVWEECWRWMRFHTRYSDALTKQTCPSRMSTFEKQQFGRIINFRHELRRLRPDAERHDLRAWDELIAFWDAQLARHDKKTSVNKKRKR